MSACDVPDMIENRSLDELEVGDQAEIHRVLRKEDIELFAVVSGDVNPAHLDPEYAGETLFHHVIAHGMWGGALISAVLGTRLPGPGTIYLDQSLRFRRPVAVGDRITVRVTVADINRETGRVGLDCLCLNQKGAAVIEGRAEVLAPRQKVRREATALPTLRMHRPGARFQSFVDAARQLPPLATAIVHPTDELSVAGAVEAQRAGLIEPVWIGPAQLITAAAAAAGVTLDHSAIVEAPHRRAAAEIAATFARQGRVGALMKGDLPNDDLLAAILDRETGLVTDRSLSHVFALDVPDHERLLFVTDAAINFAPDLSTLRDIVQNAIDLALALGVETPRTAMLSALEDVTANLPSTLMAASICKMHDRGQILGGVIDGPLALDNAISPNAAAAKKIVSEVAGRADILVAPNLESASMIARQLVHLAAAETAGVALGAQAPVIMTSRTDSPAARRASAALARLYAARTPKPAIW